MAGSSLRVNFDRRCGLRLPLDVCFPPKATFLLRCNEMTSWAKNGLMQCRKWLLQRSLLVQPHVLVTIAVIRAVHHDGDALDVGLPAGAWAAVEDDRTGDVLLQLLVDHPDQLPALPDVGFLRLLVEQLFDLLVAIAGVVALRAAGIVLIERLVGVVDGVARKVEPERVVLARDLREPLRG